MKPIVYWPEWILLLVLLGGSLLLGVSITNSDVSPDVLASSLPTPSPAPPPAPLRVPTSSPARQPPELQGSPYDPFLLTVTPGPPGGSSLRDAKPAYHETINPTLAATVVTWQLPSSFGLPTGPRIITDPLGRVWFGSSSSGRVGRFNPVTREVTEWEVPHVAQAYSVLLDPAGHAWFVNYRGSDLVRLDPNTARVTLWQTDVTPSGLSHAPDGQLFFVERVPNNLVRLNPTTGQMTRWHFASPGWLVQTVVDRAGLVWFTDDLASQLGRLNPTTNEVIRWSLPERSRPWSIALAPTTGLIWLAFRNLSQAASFDPRTATLSRYDSFWGFNIDPQQERVWGSGDQYGELQGLMLRESTPTSDVILSVSSSLVPQTTSAEVRDDIATAHTTALADDPIPFEHDYSASYSTTYETYYRFDDWDFIAVGATDDTVWLADTLSARLLRFGGPALPSVTPLPPPPRPSNDECESASQIPSTGPWPQVFTEDTRNATEPRDTLISCIALDGHGVWYRWLAPLDGLLMLSTCGSDYDTALGVWEAPACLNDATAIACNDDTCGQQSYLRVAVQEGHEYYVKISSYNETAGGRLRLQVDFRPADARQSVNRWELPEGFNNLGVSHVPVDDEGAVWLVASTGNGVGRFDPVTRAVTMWQLPGGTGPRISAVTDKRYVWFVSRAGNAVGRLDTTTNAMTRWSIVSGSQGLGVDSMSNVFFTAGEHDIAHLDPASGFVKRWTIGQVTSPSELATDAEGRVWFIDTASSQFGRLNPTTNIVSLWPLPPPSQPSGLAYDPSTALTWLALTGSDSIASFDGSLLRQYSSPSLYQPLYVGLAPNQLWSLGKIEPLIGRLTVDRSTPTVIPLSGASQSVTSRTEAANSNVLSVPVQTVYLTDGVEDLAVFTDNGLDTFLSYDYALRFDAVGARGSVGWASDGARRILLRIASTPLPTVTPRPTEQPVANDECVGAIEIPSSGPWPYYLEENTSEATESSAEPTLCTSTSHSVWFRWTSLSEGDFEVNTCNTIFTFDTVLGVWEGGGCGALVALTCSDDSCGPQSRVRFEAHAGVTYLIKAASYGETPGGPLKLTFRFTPSVEPGPTPTVTVPADEPTPSPSPRTSPTAPPPPTPSMTYAPPPTGSPQPGTTPSTTPTPAGPPPEPTPTATPTRLASSFTVYLPLIARFVALPQR